MKKDYTIFINTIFFVLGFSVIFSIIGVLLQTVFSHAPLVVLKWLGRVGGIIIIIFGIYLLGFIKIRFFEISHKLKIKKRFNSAYLTSFVFGAAFAVSWTPCVSGILGAILTLAVVSPTHAAYLLFAYSLGLGIPFLLVGLFTDHAKKFITATGNLTKYLSKIFGVILILLGILVFTNQLSSIANFSFAADFLIKLNLNNYGFNGSLNIGIAFIGGLLSFLSPCILPLIPTFLAYLAFLTVKD
ncbi:MAG: cytochrome c biogenesis protein CcdA [Nanoarchaeota archaeon]